MKKRAANKRGDNHKERILRLLGILESKTDEKNTLTARQLLEYLGYDDTPHHRRDVRRDILVLRNNGYDIRHVKRPYQYYLGKRHFRSEETKVLIDIVQSARSIDEETSRQLTDSILALSAPTTNKVLKAGIRLGNRAKTHNEATFHNIGVIQSALAYAPAHRIQFAYFDLGFNLEPVYRYDSDSIEETPVLITYMDENYYLISYSTDKRRLVTRRIDRMSNVIDTGKKGADNKTIKSFDLDHFEREQFGMFIEPAQKVTLLAQKRAMNALYDHFGDSMAITRIDEDHARVTVSVSVSMQFIGWVVGLGDLVQVETDLGVDWEKIAEGLEAFSAGLR